jgi:hypothetical protein
MKVLQKNGNSYKLPSSLNDFQTELYIHLINWKWKYITTDPGFYIYKNKAYEYDAILPVNSNYPLLYPEIIDDLMNLKKRYDFRQHIHFNHMASSQAANANLFLPILLNINADLILKKLKPDFKTLAKQYLYQGFRIEFWDGNSESNRGVLGDHNSRSGTDTDIAIAYYNMEDELCIWLIDHKLTEKEFTKCGSYSSKGRDKTKHLCQSSFDDILKNKNLCYYKDVRKFNYWEITDRNKSFFVNHNSFASCPFRGGLNQLWRNQLLGFALEENNDQPFKKATFSVVHHPDNHYLEGSIKEYRKLINKDQRFSAFTSNDVIMAASKINNEDLNKWIVWYKELYDV